MQGKRQGGVADQEVRSLARTLENIRSWATDYLTPWASKVDRIDRFVARLETSPDLYAELRTTREELWWIRTQEYIREARNLVVLMREASAGSEGLASTIDKLREAHAKGVDLSEIGTGLPEIAAKDRAGRASAARKAIGSLRQEAFLPDMRLEEVDRRLVRIRSLLGDKGANDPIGLDEIGTTESELSSLRKPAVIRDARRLLGEIREQIQWDRSVGSRFGLLEVRLAEFSEGCRVLGMSLKEYEELREVSFRSQNWPS